MNNTAINNTAFAKEKARPGYKKTKLGWIPEEWDFKPISSVTPRDEKYGIVDGPFGSNLKRIHYKNSGIPIITSGYVTSNKFIANDYLYVTKEKFRQEKRSAVQPGDIVMAKIGAKCGTSAILPIAHQEGILSGNALKIKIDNTRHSTFYVWQVLLNLYRIRKIDVLKSVGAQPAISMSSLKKFKIPLPPLPEQQKIASILNTWDKAIAAQEQLIAQKQELKKGLMQALLTGKKRFDGFEGKWIKTELKEIGTIIRGASPRPKGDPRYYGGNVPRLMVKDVTRDGKYVTPKIDFLTEAGAAKSRPCKAGTLTIVCSGDVGVPSFLAVDACIHDGFLAILDLNDKLIIPDFLYYQLKRLRNRMERSATHGGVFTNLTTTILKDFVIEVPSIKEQLAITTILSKTDKEQEKEELQLKNLISQKQGLMQQLLTGEKRVKI